MPAEQRPEADPPVAAPPLGDPSQVADLLGIPFSDEQLRAIAAPLEPAVIVAGAGSGKTTVMAARVVWLVGSGQVRPDQILGLTFTNKAAGELGQRIRQALDRLDPQTRAGTGHTGDLSAGAEDLGEPTVSTYHAYAGRLITEHGLRLGVEPDSRLLTDAVRYQLGGVAVGGYEGSLPLVSTHLPTTIGNVLKLDAEMSEHLVTPAQVRAFDSDLREILDKQERPLKLHRSVAETTAKRDELVTLVEAYRTVKRRRGAMDFSDQMALGARLALELPEVGALERDRFRVVLLDEYQDTSVAQRLMLTGLFADGTAAEGLGHPVTAVGDPCQAIYGWRGASVSNLDEFPDHFRTSSGQPAASYPLSVNRRCGKQILDAANAHAAPLYERHRGVRRLTAGETGPGRVVTALFERYAEQLDWIADRVAVLPSAYPGLEWKQVGVLVHRMRDARELQLRLRRRGIPVEVVGLGGLLTRPEVADVVATLQVLHDLTANPSLLRLLTGPRWRIGPRDLALLGRRARELAHVGDERRELTLAEALEDAVAGVDVTEIVSLADALDDPGPAEFSAAARARFAELSAELRELRRHAGEPLVDLARRVIDTIGVDIELVAAPGEGAAQARDNLAAFVDAVGEFAGSDDEASLPALLSYLEAEEEHAQGLPVATPTDTDSVKVLTVHKAKGLEWDVVFVPELTETVFPSTQGRGRWIGSAEVLPAELRGDGHELPRIEEWSTKGRDAFVEDCKAHEGLEERRLGYVAFTRARRLLVATGCWWGDIQKTKRGPSEYLRQLHDPAPSPSPSPRDAKTSPRDAKTSPRDAETSPRDAETSPLEVATSRRAATGAVPDDVRVPRTAADPFADAPWAPEPEAEQNPHLAERVELEWPAQLDAAALAQRRTAAEAVERARVQHRATGGHAPDEPGLSTTELERVAAWDTTIDQLLDEARQARTVDRAVELPATLSASQLMQLRADPERLARSLARPMPRRPSPSARFGTRFHAWVESHFGQQPLLDPSELPGAADSEIGSDRELAELIEAFRAGPFGSRRPYAVEAPFALALDGQVIRGRIDAVYQTANGYDVVDWKTNVGHTADPLQLAIYRLAWSELAGVPPESVTASFYYVRSGDVVTPDGLPGRAELQRLLALDQ